ncbi:retropepsin-like aspartic protease [Aestuariibaculum suncheonense]|uniref:Retroviral-like aspartic protease family protein n=1 Tax=Aestuariibaculum suncheonense TaxID=1028745 RepID=A0A8J6QB43_9FLAO|nr:retropepsin-like aspartic protease [Aestuariibaculum suncheonense]MBD0834470.1 retroviral-like aspartic protease family protein [Aestuariibaculum suncheonense]
MKKLILCIFFIFPILNQAQKLSIEETISYINNSFSDNSYQYNLELSHEGIINIYRDKKDNPKFPYLSKISMHWSEITIGKNSSGNPLQIFFYCTKKDNFSLSAPSCITVEGMLSGNYSNQYIFIDNKYRNDKLYNAFNYLISELGSSEKYNRNDDDDPFAPNNFDKKKSHISGSNYENKIKLETYGGVYKVWVKIGNLNKHFVLDSGASEISLSKNTERELIDNGIITQENYIEPALFKLADGTIIKCRRLMIPELTIGNYKIKNVRASIGVSDSPLLLGRSFLDNFRKWSIDNSSKELILEK